MAICSESMWPTQRMQREWAARITTKSNSNLDKNQTRVAHDNRFVGAFVVRERAAKGQKLIMREGNTKTTTNKYGFRMRLSRPPSLTHLSAQRIRCTWPPSLAQLNAPADSSPLAALSHATKCISGFAAPGGPLWHKPNAPADRFVAGRPLLHN
jgi:hypothetical protein